MCQYKHKLAMGLDVFLKVSQHMNSRQDYNDDIRDNEEGNDVYIHLHQDPFEVDVQSDYDHAPQQMTAEDDYSHMNTCNKTPGLESDYYGEASWRELTIALKQQPKRVVHHFFKMPDK